MPEGPWTKFQGDAAAAEPEGPWTKYRPQEVPNDKPAPAEGVVAKLWNTIAGTNEGVVGGEGYGLGAIWDRLKGGGNLLGLPGPNALQRSSQIAGERPYRPGMKMGEMMPPDALSNPMLFAAGLGQTEGGVPGGGRVEPAPPAAPPAPVPTIPPGMQPPRPAGPALPPAQPGIPAMPGGASAPGAAPIPTIPPGIQPPRPGGQPLPPMQPGIPPVPGGGRATVPPIPTIAPGIQPPRPTGGALPPARPAEPAMPGGRVEEVSPLASAIAKNSPGDVDAAITRKYRQIIKPSKSGQQSAPAIAEQDRRILTTIDQIIANRNKLQITNEGGQVMPGALPRSIRQFAQAIDQTKKSIFEEYDALARQAGDFGVQVDLAPAIQQLREIARKPEVTDLHPNLINQAEQLAANFEARGWYSPKATQDVIENLNQVLAAFYKNPTEETVSRATLLAPVARTLRQQLDKAIEGATSPGYQALRLRYGALQSVEKDVAAAVQREAAKVPGGISGTFADIAASEEALRGIFTFNPSALVRAGGIKAAQSAIRYINNPNRAIERMFSRRQSTLTAPPPMPFQPNWNSMAASMMGQSGLGARQPMIPPPAAPPKRRPAPPRTYRNDEYIEPPPGMH